MGGAAICPPTGQFGVGSVAYDQSFAYGQGLGYNQACGQGVGIGMNQAYGYGQGVGLTTPAVVGGAGYISQGVGFTSPAISGYPQGYC
jgi:hypothetical protein